MKVLICYFSGTGNTKKIAERFAAALESEGEQAQLCNIEEHALGADVGGFDAVGFAYPVYAFNAPGIVLDFAKALEKRENKIPSFILKTSGEPVRLNDASSHKLKKILGKRGYDVTNEFRYVMPYNIIFRHKDSMAYKMWRTADKMIPLDCKMFLGKERSGPKPVFLEGLITWFLRIQQWGGRFNGKRYKVRKEKCVGCNMCVKGCPVNNISVKDGKFKFGKKCLMCMRCAFECPKDAIKIGLFEKWKVNGKYSFEPPAAEEPPSKHDNYCRKAYERYFSECERREHEAETLCRKE